jgi:hypothetical protein
MFVGFERTELTLGQRVHVSAASQQARRKNESYQARQRVNLETYALSGAAGLGQAAVMSKGLIKDAVAYNMFF